MLRRRLGSVMLAAVASVTALAAQSRPQSKQTPAPAADAPQRTIFTTPSGVHSESDKSARPAADPPGRLDPTVNSLGKAIENLDTIRDANLGRVQKEGCPPEVAARIADLKNKLQGYESGSLRTSTPVALHQNSAPPDPLAIATEWYKPAAASATRGSQQTKVLAEVLPGVEAPPPKTQVDAQELARTKAELEQLSGACAASTR